MPRPGQCFGKCSEGLITLSRFQVLAGIVGPYKSVDCENPNEFSARLETRSPEGQVEDMGVILSSFSSDVQLHRVHPLR